MRYDPAHTAKYLSQSNYKVALDYTRRPYCECGEAFLQWIREHFGGALDGPTTDTLDEAVLAISLEFAERIKELPERSVAAHPFNSCVLEVYVEVLELLTTKRNELLRMPKKAPEAHLYIGEEDTEVFDPLG